MKQLWIEAEAMKEGLETSLRYDVEALRNLSFKLSLQSMPRIRVDVDGHDSNSKVWLPTLFASQMGHIQLETWKMVHAMLSFVDADVDTDKGLREEMMAHITRRALMSSGSVWELLHHLGNRCLPNIFTGSCGKDTVGGQGPEINEHLEIFQRFPPIQGPHLDGQMLDFLGISTKVAVACYEGMHILLAPSRHFECRYQTEGRLLRNWPFVDEEYMEWADVLTMANAAAQRSSPERGLRVAEIGAGPIGLWGVRTAKAYLQQSPDINSPCEVLLVEPYDLGNESELKDHIMYNLPEGRCKIRVHREPVESAEDLKQLLATGDQPWSLLDIDAQGYEYHMLCCGMISWLARRVERLHVSTHSRAIHRRIVEWLTTENWTILADSIGSSLVDYKHLHLGPFITNDGHITATPHPPAFYWT